MTLVVSTENKAPTVRDEAELVGDPMGDSTFGLVHSGY